MQVTFNSAADPAGARLIARIVEPGKMPADLERPLAQGAQTARFTGKAGQLFEGFVERVKAWRREPLPANLRVAARVTTILIVLALIGAFASAARAFA